MSAPQPLVAAGDPAWDAAWDAYQAACGVQDPPNPPVLAMLQAAAPLIVADELRRLAGEMSRRAMRPGKGSEHYRHGVATTWDDAAALIRERADELDGDRS